MPVNLNSLGAEVDSELSSLRSELIDAMNDEKRHIDTYESLYLPNHYLHLPDEIDTAIESIDDINIALQNVINTIDEYELPERPAIFDEEIIRYNEEIFNHAYLTEIQSVLDSMYSSFSLSSGISRNGSDITAIQEAIYNYRLEIQEELLTGKIHDLAYSWAADGYEDVPGAMTYKTSEILNDFDIKITEGSNNAFFKIAKTIQDNIKNSMSHGISIEDIHMDFTNKYTKNQEIALDNAVKAYTAEVEKVLSEVKAPVKQIGSIVKAFKVDTTIEAEAHSLNLKKSISELKSYVDVTNSAISASVEKFNASVKASEALASSYGSLFAAYGSEFTGVAMEEQSVEE